MEQMLDFMYFWAKDAPMVHATEEAEVYYVHTSIDWCNFMRGHWVFGGIECGNPHNAFLQEVPDRRAVTLNPILQQFVAQDTIVNMDQWAAYNGIAQLPEGYGHTTINHGVNFVDAHTHTHTHTGR